MGFVFCLIPCAFLLFRAALSLFCVPVLVYLLPFCSVVPCHCSVFLSWCSVLPISSVLPCLYLSCFYHCPVLVLLPPFCSPVISLLVFPVIVQYSCHVPISAFSLLSPTLLPIPSRSPCFLQLSIPALFLAFSSFQFSNKSPLYLAFL